MQTPSEEQETHLNEEGVTLNLETHGERVQFQKPVVPDYESMTYDNFRLVIANLTEAGYKELPITGVNFENTDIDGEALEFFRRALSTCESAFARDNEELGQTDIVEHGIETGSAKPVKQRAYRVPYIQREKLEREVKRMLEMGVIKLSKSPLASPIVLVGKPEVGEIRFCIDYRKLSSVTVKDALPLPLIEPIFDQLKGAVYFSTLDLQGGYWQIRMAQKDKHKTAFTCHLGLFEYEVMPFGLANAPATFQRLIQTLLSGFGSSMCLCFIDDIIIFSAGDSDLHAFHVCQVVATIAKVGLKFKGKSASLQF